MASLRSVGAPVSLEASGRVTAPFSQFGIDYPAAQHCGIDAVRQAGQ